MEALADRAECSMCVRGGLPSPRLLFFLYSNNENVLSVQCVYRMPAERRLRSVLLCSGDFFIDFFLKRVN